jgi:hypothetical protein
MKKPLSLLLLSSVLMAGASQALAAPAIVSTFTGADPGEGLDLQGNFTYALDISPGTPSGKVGDAVFTSDNITGAQITANQSIAVGGWGAVAYGDTQDDMNLSRVMSSIRWGAAPTVVTITLKVEPGAEYKLQLLEHEDCCEGRGFNLVINGTTEVTQLQPGKVQQGPDGEFGDFLSTKNSVGVVVTKQFVADSPTVTIVLDGPAATDPAVTDHNATISGLTLERLTPLGDTDGDGLTDEWEFKVFGSLAETGAGDADADGLTNLEEFTGGTDALKKDTDGDLLADGEEVKTYHTDPLKVDSDGDSLQDGFEVKTVGTDPTKMDTDGDGVNDDRELIVGSNPKDATNMPRNTSVGVVTGGDPGEGLDLEGNFLYALAVGAGPEAYVQVGDAAFQPIFADEVPGALLEAVSTAGNWYQVVYGDSEADLALASATASIRYSGTVTLTLDGLEPGGEYKLQLLFGEACCNRGFGVYRDGHLIAHDFNVGLAQGGIANNKQEAVITHTFYAEGTSTVIRLDVAAATFPDANAILNAVTLEQVAAAADSDGDGLPDGWETAAFGNLSQTAEGDADGDSVSNLDEFNAGTNPNKADTDGDGLSDSEEVTFASNGNFADTDLDRLDDKYEATVSHTSATSRDSDSDSLSDFSEVNVYLTDPAKADTDGDGVVDGVEVVLGTNPLVADRQGLTSVGIVRGGDPGEGLDLEGNFIYALALGAGPEAYVQVGDAAFQPLIVDEVAGAVVGATTTAANWYQVNYGETDNDINLAAATSSIRYRGNTLTLDLSDLEIGSEYKLQLMFGEQCCNRGFNVFVDGARIVKDFNPGVVQGGIGNGKQEAVISHIFFAKKSSVSIRLDIAGVPFPDTNPIMNAATLERMAGPADTDGDGLQDEWEKFFFGSLAQTGAGDTDNDGVSNLLEYTLGSDPLAAEPTRDSDGDGITDVDEVKVTTTDPAKADTDDDGLMDGLEVNVYHTDAKKADTDGDGSPDGTEVAYGTDPLVSQPATTISNVEVNVIFGGDEGEGLDMKGQFAYAVNVGPSTIVGSAQIGDAVFTGETTPGIAIQTQFRAGGWYPIDIGDSPEDDVLDQVLSSIIYGGAPTGVPRPTITMDVVPGTKYKLQVILGEACCDGRGFNIVVDGQVIKENFFPAAEQGGLGSATGVAVTAEIETKRDKLVLVMDGAGSNMEGVLVPDRNAILNGFTLEQLSASPTSAKFSSVVLDAGGVTFTFTSSAGKKYSLEYKEKITDAQWTTVNGDISGTGSTTSFRDGDAGRRGKGTGFYRLMSL